jgi:hypothetical protein
MAGEKPETDGFLAGIEAKIAALTTLRESYLRAVSVGAWGQPGDIDSGAFMASGGGGRGDHASIELPTGAFLNKSVPEAIKLFLSAVRKKQTGKEIADALREGGIESTSRRFDKTVLGTMYRMKDAGVLLQFKDGWGLAELYPEHLRNRIAQESKPPKRGKAKGRGKPSAKAQNRPPREASTSSTGRDKTATAIRLLASRGTAGATVLELFDELKANGIQCERKYVRGILSKLFLLGKAERQDGRYVLKVGDAAAA